MQTLSPSFTGKHIMAGIFAASLLSLSAGLAAQTRPPEAGSAASPAHLVQSPEQPEASSVADVSARQRVNEEQAAFARNQLAQNAANQAEYERRLAEFEATKARIAADDAAAWSSYEAETKRVAAEKARLEADHAAAMARWEANVAACKAGDFARCSGS